ncbi:MAG: bacillithiol biosynthesis BshC [Actinomycetota bacterium]|nr:bacillithiol biosynthesis BshC [Actinomycetota bacterium]
MIIDPVMEEIKQLSSDLIGKDIDLGIKAGELVDDAGIRLKNSGYHAQLEKQGEYLNFFVTRDGNRKKIKADGRQYRWEGQTFSAGQIKEKFADCMSDLSFNVVLRPIIQDSLFPVVATVCGPGEISYFAQLGPAYKLYGVQMPVIYPRFSATLIEKSVNNSLEKYGIDYQYIWEEPGFMEKMVLKRHMDVDINRAVEDLNSKITENIEEAEKALSESLMNISSAFDRIKRNIDRETTVLGHKLYSQYKKQNQHIKKAVEKIKLNLLPHGNMQEREISVISYINKYDFRLIDEIYNEFRCFDFGHKIIEVE